MLTEEAKARQGRRITILQEQLKKIKKWGKSWQKTAHKRRRKYKELKVELEKIRAGIIAVRAVSKWTVYTPAALKFCEQLFDDVIKKRPLTEEEKKLILTPKPEKAEKKPGILKAIYQKAFPEKPKRRIKKMTHCQSLIVGLTL